MTVFVTVFVTVTMLMMMFVLMIAAAVVTFSVMMLMVVFMMLILYHYGDAALYRVYDALNPVADVFLLGMYLKLGGGKAVAHLVKAGSFGELVFYLSGAVGAVQTFEYEFVLHSITSFRDH